MPRPIVLGDPDDLLSWDAEPSRAHPDVTLLLGASLLTVVLVCVLPVPLLQEVRQDRLAEYLAVTLFAALVGIGPFLTARCQTRTYASLALITFDALPLAMAATVHADVPTRAWASLILIPVLVTASTATPRVFRIELVIGNALGLTLLIAGAPSVFEALLTCVGFLFFMVVCASLTRQDWTAVHGRFAEFQRRSRTDELTGLLNRRGFVAGFPELRRQALAANQPLGMIMIDIDHFSRINAAHGHLYGDRVLRQLCEAVVRLPAVSGGLVARIGGEELVVIVPGPAAPVAAAVRAVVTQAGIHPALTISMGIADSDPRECSGADALWRMVNQVDSAMYTAKSSGRDRIVRASGAMGSPVTPPALAVRAAPVAKDALTRTPGLTLSDDEGDDRLDYRLFGAFVVSFAVIGALAFVGQVAIDRSSTWADPFLILLLISGCIGVVAVWRGRALEPWLAVLLVSSFELATLTGVLATHSVEHRMMEACLLAMPALVAAHSMSRRWVLFHTALVFVGAGLAAYDPQAAAEGARWIYLTASLGVPLSAGPAVLFWMRERRAEASARLRLLAALDPLTGVHNRRGLEHSVLAAAPPGRREVLSVNIEGFKRFNDSYGHVFGDNVLRLLASSISGAVDYWVRINRAMPGSAQPVVGRTGGDHFVVVSTRLDPEMVNRIRLAVASIPVEMSTSFGQAVGTIDDAADLWTLVAAADVDLARTKPLR